MHSIVDTATTAPASCGHVTYVRGHTQPCWVRGSTPTLPHASPVSSGGIRHACFAHDAWLYMAACWQRLQLPAGCRLLRMPGTPPPAWAASAGWNSITGPMSLYPLPSLVHALGCICLHRSGGGQFGRHRDYRPLLATTCSIVQRASIASVHSICTAAALDVCKATFAKHTPVHTRLLAALAPLARGLQERAASWKVGESGRRQQTIELIDMYQEPASPLAGLNTNVWPRTRSGRWCRQHQVVPCRRAWICCWTSWLLCSGPDPTHWTFGFVCANVRSQLVLVLPISDFLFLSLSL